MSSSAHAPSHSDSRRQVHFFAHGEKCEKTLELLVQKVLEKALRDQTLGENLGDHREELECRRSAPQYAATSLVLGENLEDTQKNDDLELECRLSAHQRAAKNLVLGENLEDIDVLLHKTLLTPVLGEDRLLHIRQSWNVSDLLGSPLLDSVMKTNCSMICSTGTSRN